MDEGFHFINVVLHLRFQKFPLSKEFGKAPFSEKVKNEQFLNNLFQSELCMTDGECESYREFRLYLSDTESYVTYFTNTTCINPETLPAILETCNEGPIPIAPPCYRFTDSCLIDELRKQGQCSSGQLGSFQKMLTHAQNRCEQLIKNSMQWRRYLNLIEMKVDFLHM
ncbi:Protein CBG21557 [Caenorhabditis briggsae]|uniref:Protein CBG21557 n=1 Tax=Caenorhabditis briggsae TaxID=6238 RepID=A8Y0D4_CAEBR|nr:Protein CBG21557 [Caenorhabditis briggsae]CAP38319.2 Protein CBG21557 [Caenorhabditis briggsae]